MDACGGCYCGNDVDVLPAAYGGSGKAFDRIHRGELVSKNSSIRCVLQS